MAAKKIKEESIETRLREGCAAKNGVCIKLNPNWYMGIPDRLCVFKTDTGETVICFVELKRPVGGRLSLAQKWWKKMLTRLGVSHYVVHTKALVDEILKTGRIVDEN